MYISDDAGCSHVAGAVTCVISGLISNNSSAISLTTQSGYTGQSSYKASTLIDVNYTLADGVTVETLAQRTLRSTSVNQAPGISGTSVTVVPYNSAYLFTPTAVDSNGDSLTFSILNKPAWVTFNTSTGALSGAPLVSDVNPYNNIIISY